MQAGPSGSSQSDSEAILPSFLAILRSSSPISIPTQTLLGAITHYLSTLQRPLLTELVETISTSSSLWNSPGIPLEEIRNAIRVSVPTKIALIEDETKEVYFAQSRKRRRARIWLKDVLNPINDVESCETRLQYLVSLLEGVSDVSNVDWGAERVRLEEEVVLGLADALDRESSSGMMMLYVAMPNIDVSRLSALDMAELSPRIHSSLVELVKFKSGQKLQKEAPIISRALARSFDVLEHGGPTSQHNAWETMRSFCMEIRGVGEALEKECNGHVEATQWDGHKTAFFSFLLPASAILDLSLRDKGNSAWEINGLPRSADMAIQLLLALASFSYLTDVSSGGFENYHRVLYGNLDILAAHGGTTGVDELFREVTNGRTMTDARAAFVLLLGDELVHQLGSRCVDTLLPLAEKHAHRPEHRASFEAAHAFLLSLLGSASKTLDTTIPQADFFDSLISQHLHILTKQAKRGGITSDQIKQAFPLVVEAASRRSPSSVQLCVDYLKNLPDSQERKLIQVIIAPHMPAGELSEYLDSLARVIMSTPKDSEERLELARRAFEMVIKDMGDDVKEIGVEWWMKWRSEFEGRSGSDQGFARSRL
ncbi:hypothetical protein IAR55_004847 [Kwoniella newhampshirensis]|uniref:Uncharacterized protein n=1 Tax=Kwoniella newhampshirensis TaxID=1651941 RepID=A0AAW0YW70_9TREE